MPVCIVQCLSDCAHCHLACRGKHSLDCKMLVIAKIGLCKVDEVCVNAELYHVFTSGATTQGWSSRLLAWDVQSKRMQSQLMLPALALKHVELSMHLP